MFQDQSAAATKHYSILPFSLNNVLYCFIMDTPAMQTAALSRGQSKTGVIVQID